jgi:UDP-sugar diphosphatase
VASAGLDDVVAEAPVPLDRAQETVVGGECRVGNFVADAYRWAAGTDLGLQNSGGIRAGPPLAGAVTMADLVSVVPFEEQVVIAEVTGAELRDILVELSGTAVDFGEPGWWHGHVSGAETRWDAAGERLLEATVGGDPLADDRRYTVAAPDYLLHSEHEFPTLAERHRAGEAGIQHEVLADYAREHGVAAPVEGRVRLGEDDRPAPG